LSSVDCGAAKHAARPFDTRDIAKVQVGSGLNNRLKLPENPKLPAAAPHHMRHREAFDAEAVFAVEDARTERRVEFRLAIALAHEPFWAAAVGLTPALAGIKYSPAGWRVGARNSCDQHRPKR